MKQSILLLVSLIATLFLKAQTPNLEWAKGFTGSLGYGRSVAVDASGNVCTTGEFYGTTDFDPGPGTFTLTASGPPGVFISKLDANGNFVWAKQLTGGGGYG